MKGSIFLFLFSAFLLCSNYVGAQTIEVDDNFTAQQLVQDVLVNSPCAEVSNFSVTSDPALGSARSYGYFSAGNSNFPFAEGIILSTGYAYNAVGPNTSILGDGSESWAGDPDLQAALGISFTYNASVLEFDFTPLTSQISFRYIFASEEYAEDYACSYSDAFAFLLKPAGSAEPYQNLAVIPGTSIPVSVVNVHPNIPGACSAQNVEYFNGYNGGLMSATNFNGQTVPLTASATVIPGVTYHIKLVIADQGDSVYDSAIFLEGGSFDVGVDLGLPRLLSNGNPICGEDSYELDATQVGNNSYQWFQDDIAITAPIGTNPILNVTETGTYKVIVSIGSTTCIATGEARIEFAPPLLLSDTTLVECDAENDGTTLFNLERFSGVLTNNDNSIEVRYFTNLQNAQDNIQPITDTDSYEANNNTLIYARIENRYGCSGIAKVLLQTTFNPIANMPVESVCDIDDEPVRDGIYTFNLSNIDSQVVAGLPSGLNVRYYLAEDDALLNNSPLPNDFRNTIPNVQTIYARILNGPDCFGVIPVTLKVNVFQPSNFDDESINLCEGSEIILSVRQGFGSYLWSTSETSNAISVSQPGIYSVIVTDSVTGCTAIKTFTVIAFRNPTIENVEVSSYNTSGNTVLVVASGDGALQYSIDGENFQANPYFQEIPTGEYQITVRSDSGCPDAVKSFFSLGYPKYFTPNGDGYNDMWSIPFLKA